MNLGSTWTRTFTTAATYHYVCGNHAFMEGNVTVTSGSSGGFASVGFNVAGSNDDKVYFFDKDSSTPIWSYTTSTRVNKVAISADGKYIVAGSDDDHAYAFKNSLADRPSVIPYGPRSGSEPDEPVTLRWFAGSDDSSNLTFDVYFGTNSSSLTKVKKKIDQQMKQFQ